MKEHRIKMAKREFPLVFSLGTLQLLEETIDGFDLAQVDELLRSTKGLLELSLGQFLLRIEDLDRGRGVLHCGFEFLLALQHKPGLYFTRHAVTP